MPGEQSLKLPCNVPLMPLDKSSTAIHMGQPKEPFYSVNNLYKAFKNTKKASSWKFATQLYETNLLANLTRLSHELETCTFKLQPFHHFTYYERGNKRDIKASCVRDRIVFRAIADYVLLPAVKPHLIYDNYASLKDRGLSRARNRMLTMLHRYYRKHGAHGYILQGDFKKFFASLPHAKVIAYFNRYVHGPLEQYYVAMAINCFDGNKGVGIGSTVSQIVGLAYPTVMDNCFKCVLSCKYYGRYMDDFFIISPDLAFLKRLKTFICEYAHKLELAINCDKTKITDLRKGFVYLKTHYFLQKSGKVYYNPCRSTFMRERRRLHKFYRRYQQGYMSFNQILNCYRSWRENLVFLYENYARSLIERCDKCFEIIYGVRPV